MLELFSNVGALYYYRLHLIAAASILVLCDVHGAMAGDAQVAFDREIRPLLARACFQCHGPDAQSRVSDLRLDRPQDLTQLTSSGHPLVTPGKPQNSELWQRIASDDPEWRMPPEDARTQLTERDRERIRLWIESGAETQVHWAFRPILRPEVPQLAGDRWSINPIDRFVLQKLREAGAEPLPPADRRTLIRRVTFDLTGLPPTPEEVDAFVADRRPHAYERLVDRLLASPRYGERMAVPWLDAARYADTNGHFMDNGREMWAWRDWVIDALNANMPFDQFSIEQLAGDLLPDATQRQVLASGFHRNHGLNFEAGALEEECRVGYVIDRTDTTATVWLGLTLQCARCHDHPYDPITQREYYQLYAFFNSIDEDGVAGHWGNAEPILFVWTPQQQQRLEEIDRLQERLSALLPAETPEEDIEDDATVIQPDVVLDEVPDGLVGWYPLDDAPNYSLTNAMGDDAEIDGRAFWERGYRGDVLALLGQTTIDCGYPVAAGTQRAFTCVGWFFIDSPDAGTLFAQLDDTESDPIGFEAKIKDGNIVVRIMDGEGGVLEIRTLYQGFDAWTHVAICYDGSTSADGIHVFLNGREVAIQVIRDDPLVDADPAVTFRVGGRESGADFVGLVDLVAIFENCLSGWQVRKLWRNTQPWAVHRAPRDADDSMEAGQSTNASKESRSISAREAQRAYDRWTGLQLERLQIQQSAVTTMVMRELPSPRPTHVLIRGQYDHPGEIVEADVPQCLPPFPEGAPRNRLGLARWLFSPDHPLTARVAVNRAWKLFFGTGIVPSISDFGAQGEPPRSAELLDWLAAEYIASGWDTKALHRMIVTSATYRQAAATPSAVDQRGTASSIWLHGMPRRSLTAEMIRDAALSYGGLLDGRIGGPSVFPFQPPGLWKENSFRDDYTAQEYVPSEGGDLYRRAVYTFWKRTCPPPHLVIFGAPSREVCVVERPESTSPLQALVLMNGRTEVESARGLARRILAAGGSDAERIEAAYRIVLSRLPDQQEMLAVTSLLRQMRVHFAANRRAARQLMDGEISYRSSAHSYEELAAWTIVSSTLMNLHEARTRN